MEMLSKAHDNDQEGGAIVINPPTPANPCLALKSFLTTHGVTFNKKLEDNEVRE